MLAYWPHPYSAAAEDGWTSKTFFAAADQHGETSVALTTYNGNWFFLSDHQEWLKNQEMENSAVY